MDIEFLLVLQGLREAAGTDVTNFILASSDFLLNVAWVLVALVIYWGFDKVSGRIICMSFGIGSFVNTLVKMTACVDRPYVRDPRVTPPEVAMKGGGGYSFPSGHTQSAASLFGAAGWCYRAHPWFLALMVIFCLYVGFSRLYVGVHTPQEVLCGFALGALAVFCAQRLNTYLAREDARPTLVFVVGLVIGVAAVAFMLLKPYPEESGSASATMNAFMGSSNYFGVLIGWYLEQRFVNFTTDGSARDKAIRIVVGLVLTIGAFNLAGLTSGFVAMELAMALPGFIAGIVALWGAPALSELIISKL